MNRIDNKRLLELIGEVENVTLHSLPDGHGVVVYITVAGEEYELIRDSGTLIDHNITRIGIAGVLERGPASRTQ